MLKLNANSGVSRVLVLAGFVLGSVTGAQAEGVSFAEKILPVLKERCFSCHGPEKAKGELRLDSVEAINKGSEHGAVLVPGKPEESSFYKLLVLPKDDPDIMPAKGDPLTEEQTKAVFDWITEGANFGDWKAEEAAPAPAKN
jgi:mono/diheme cytochrome c family protein